MRERVPEGDFRDDEDYRLPGLRTWMHRNVWFLVRLGMVVVFTFGTSLVASQFSYGLEGNPIRLTAEQINAGELPPEAREGSYVQVVGTPQVGENLTPENIGTEESRIGVSARYSVPYFYFRTQEMGDNLLIQTGNGLPNFEQIGDEPQVWEGSLSSVGTVIFHDTTQAGLERAGLPQDERIPVVEVGETPEAYRALFPTYSAIVAVWLASLGWLLWKRNAPFA